jgi:hypothetical protein
VVAGVATLSGCAPRIIVLPPASLRLIVQETPIAAVPAGAELRDPHLVFPECVMSKDLAHFAFIVNRGPHCSVVMDGVEGKAYDQVSWPTMTASGDQLAYAAVLGEEWFIVVNGVEQYRGNRYRSYLDGGNHSTYPSSYLPNGIHWYHYEPLYPIVASPNGKRLACIVNAQQKWRVVCDAHEGKEYDDIASPGVVFSADSEHWAYGARDGEEWLAVVDGVERPDRVRGGVRTFWFWSHGSEYRTAFVVQGDNGCTVSAVGVERPQEDCPCLTPFSTTGDLCYSSRNGPDSDTPVADSLSRTRCMIRSVLPSRPGEGVAYKADELWTRRSLFTVDGVAGPGYWGGGGYLLSSDEQHFACLRKGRRRTSLIVDGVENTASPFITDCRFGPDGRRLSFRARESEDALEEYVGFVEDGKVFAYQAKGRSLSNGQAPVFSPDGRHIVWFSIDDGGTAIVIDGARTGTLGNPVCIGRDFEGSPFLAEPIFVSPNKVRAVVRRGNQFLRLDIEIVE